MLRLRKIDMTHSTTVVLSHVSGEYMKTQEGTDGVSQVLIKEDSFSIIHVVYLVSST